MSVFLCTANDTAPLIVTIRDQTTGLPIDLTAVTSISLKFAATGTTVALATVTPTVYGTPTNGQISIPMTTLLASRAAGTYDGEVSLTTASGIETLQDYMTFQVRSEFA